MFAIKKVLTPFLLPPGIFVLALIASGAYFLFLKNRKAGFFNIVIGLVMWLLSIPLVSDAVLRSLESDLTLPNNPRGDVIILLGAGVAFFF